MIVWVDASGRHDSDDVDRYNDSADMVDSERITAYRTITVSDSGYWGYGQVEFSPDLTLLDSDSVTDVVPPEPVRAPIATGGYLVVSNYGKRKKGRTIYNGYCVAIVIKGEQQYLLEWGTEADVLNVLNSLGDRGLMLKATFQSSPSDLANLAIHRKKGERYGQFTGHSGTTNCVRFRICKRG